MVQGSFDDRDDARLHVKQWLRSHSPSEYTPQNLRRLARELMDSDTEPVDHVRVAWRERVYGMVKGLVEFAGEELMHPQGGVPASLHRAHDELAKAAALLPNRLGAAIRHLRNALDMLSAHPHSAKSTERASIAANLALSMIGGSTERLAA